MSTLDPSTYRQREESITYQAESAGMGESTSC